MLITSFANVNIPLNLGWRSISPASRATRAQTTEAHNLALESGPGEDRHGQSYQRSWQWEVSIAPDAKAPLLVVSGGISVANVQIGVYLWKFMKGVEDRFHIFVAVSNQANGDKAYHSLMKIVKEHELAPPTQILYLFSAADLGCRCCATTVPTGFPRSPWSTSEWASARTLAPLFRASTRPW
jgi:hypothetical protein